MESVQQEAPPAYPQTVSHDPDSLQLPSVPLREPSPLTGSGKPTLPDIRSLGLPTHGDHGNLALLASVSPLADDQPHPIQTVPAAPVHALVTAPALQPRNSISDMGSPQRAESVMSLDEHTMRSSSASRDDNDVLIAAEALSGLGNPDYVRTPPLQNNVLPQASLSVVSNSRDVQGDPEPLLKLLTLRHPWLGGTIDGSISAYSSTMSYSPRIIQYGANLIERNIGTPMASTVGEVGRRTGVEGSIRRFLGDRRPSDVGRESRSPIRRRRLQRSRSPVGSDENAMDVDSPTSHLRSTRQSRRQSRASSYAESLPAYDENRSPQYEERAGDVQVFENGQEISQHHANRSWRTQLIISTSGLGVALSDKSLRSLRACLGMLRGATTHISNLIRALRMVAEEYESALRPHRMRDNESAFDPESAAEEKARLAEYLRQIEQQDSSQAMAARIKAISDDIWNTLKSVVTAVSRYTGGALPDNAGAVVRRQLMSVPQRWRIATASTAPEPSATSLEPARSAQRMLAFAREGLDMMAQVSAVVDGTVGSAEQWLDSMGRTPHGDTAVPEKVDTPAAVAREPSVAARDDDTAMETDVAMEVEAEK